MSFSYEKWKQKDNQRIQSNQKQLPSVKSYETWNNERNANNTKIQAISKGLNSISMEEYRKENPTPIIETPKKDSTTKEKTETSSKEKSVTKKEEKSANIFEKALSGISSGIDSTTDALSGAWKSTKAVSKSAFNIALEALGYTSPTSQGVIKGAIKSDNENDKLSEKVGSNLRAGTGDFIKQTGEGINYLGANRLGKNIANAGESFSKGYGEAYKDGKEFTWGNLLDPEYYATNVTRQVPQMATMLLGGGVGAGLKGLTSLTKLPTIAKTVVSVTGGAGAMTAMESAMEAGGVYEEAKRRGMSEKEAKSAADETFKKNLVLTGGTSLIELGLGMTPLTRGVSRMGIGKQIAARTAGGGVTEGVQEGLQEKISTEALGDDFKWTDPSTVEAMVIGGLLGGATTGGMSSLQLANTQNNSFATITKNTIDSLSAERRAEFDELVDAGRQQGKPFDEAQFDALENLASRYEDVVENTRQSTKNFIESEKLERAKKSSSMEKNQIEQAERNTLNYELPDSLPNYQFNRAAIAENPDVTSAALPPQAQMLQQLLQPSLPVQPQMKEIAPNALPYLSNNQLSPAAIQSIPNALPTNMAQLNVPSPAPPPIDNETERLQAPSPIKKPFDTLQTGDEIKLKGTKAETTYTVLEDDGGKMVKVETAAGKTINVPRNSINEIVMRVSEVNVMADPIEDIDSVVEPIGSNSVQQPVEIDTSNRKALPSKLVQLQQQIKIINDVNDLIGSGKEVETAVAELRNSEVYQNNPELLEEFDQVVAEFYSSHKKLEKGEVDTPNTDQSDQNKDKNTDQEKQQADDSAEMKEDSTDKNSKTQETDDDSSDGNEKEEKTTDAPPADTIERISWMKQKMKNLDYTAKEIKEQLQWLRGNEQSIKEDLYQYHKEQGLHKKKREEAKKKAVDNNFNNTIESLAFADKDSLTTTMTFSTSDSNLSRLKQLEDQIMNMTEESVRAHIEEKRFERKRVKNPETLQDFYLANIRRELTAEEIAKYDELKAVNTREQAKEKEKLVKKQEQQPQKVVNKGDYTIKADKDTRDGSDLWVVSLNDRVTREEFTQIKKSMKALGGYWSNFKKGFIFKEDPTAQLSGEVQEESKPLNESSEENQDAPKKTSKLKTVAEGMQKTIDAKRNDERLTNTARRAEMDANMRKEADTVEQQQRIMLRIADAIESGEAKFLDFVTARTHIETLQSIKRGIIRERLNSREAELKLENENNYLRPNEREKISKEPITTSEINALQMPKPEMSLSVLRDVVEANRGTTGLGRAAMKIHAFIKRNANQSNTYVDLSSIREEVIKLADAAIKNDKERYKAERLKETFDITKRLEAMKIDDVSILRSAMREFIRYEQEVGENTEQKQKDAQRKLEAELTQSKIDGFFPTPKKIVEEMLVEAAIEPGMKVLEPSAGKGNIALAIKEELQDGQLDVVEYNSRLSDYLKELDLNVVADDFLTYEGELYDRIVMNPPFEKGQDIDHVMHAYELLSPGGRIVAITSEGPFFRSDKKSTAFREWLEELGAVSEKLPDNTFKDSERSTGVATRMLIIDKPSKESTTISGNDGKAYTEAGTEIRFNYELVDANQLVASHDTALRANEAYPSELQPRDRSRQASQQQITTIAQKLNPELVAESVKASDGAPIVSSDYIVESGNGRTIAMQKMYKENYPTAADYKNYLVENADKFGLDAAQVNEMDNPILVRVRTNKVNRQAFVEEANVSNVASMSSVEQAVADSKKLTNKVMYLFSPSENGDLNTASNRAFIAQFIQSVVPQNERGILMTGDGALSQDGLRRVQNAILAKAYGNSEALMLMIESNDNNVKTLTNSLLQAAPAIVKMKDGIQNDAYYNEDISGDLVAAVEKFSELRNDGMSVDTYLNQTSLFDDGISNISKELLVLFDKGVFIDGKARKSVKAYKGLIDTYVEVLQAAGNPNQQSFFEDMVPTKEELFTSAIEKVRNDNDNVQANLFEDESQSSEKAGRASRREASATTDTFVGAKGNRKKSKEQVKQGETTRAEIIRFITDNFKVRVDIGQYRQRAKGVYKNQFAIIRTKDYADFEVIAHEIGHRFDMKFGWSSDPAIKQEWIKFAEENLDLPKSMTPLQKSREGVAEYFRQYLYDETEAPKNYTELSDTLQSTIKASLKKAKWDKSLATLRGQMLDWMNRDAEQELRGVVAPIGQQKSRISGKQFITTLYTKLFEREHPIFDAIKQIEKETGLKIEGRSNAYQMAVLTRGTVARAATFIKRETFNSITGESTGESLESILKDVDDVESFGRYLVARHGLYLMEKQGKSKTPLSPDLMKEYLKNGKHYEQHAERIYKYQDQLLKVLVDGNLISKDLPKTLREKYPYYVPFYRVMTETGEKTSNLGGGGSSQQYVNQQQGVKRMSAQGSARNIVNPIESIIRNTHLYFGLADRNAVGFAMSELADPEGEFAAEVTRDIIEEIPNKMKLYEAQINDIMGTLMDAGLSEDSLENMDMEATFKLFEPVFRPNSSNNEILVWKEGKPKLYKVHDTLLYNSLIAYDRRAVNDLLGGILKPMEWSNNLLRTGITASPFFTLRQFFRSLTQILVKTEATGFNYATHPLRVMKAIGSVAESRFRNNDAVTEWWKSGGAQSTFIAVEKKYMDKELNKVMLNKRARNYIRSMKQGNWSERTALNWYILKSGAALPINLFQLFNDTLDQALKLAEYQVVKKQTGSRQKAALASREADIDYKRFGSWTREYNKLVLFFNVSLQGPDNLVRTFKNHPVRTTLRSLMVLTLPTLLLYALNRDDEEYHELNSHEKDNNWLFPKGDGTFIKVPIPFELGMLFKTIPEKLFGEYLDFTHDENKQNFDDFYKNALKTMIPNYLPTIANVGYSYTTERNLSFDRDYIPQALQGLEKPEQFDENTSEIMKFIGKQTDKSPIVLQETFKAQFGQMGHFYLWGADQVLLGTGVIQKPDTKGLKRGYTERYVTASVNDGGTNSITKFYEELDKKERHYKTHGTKYAPPEDLKLYRQVSKDMSTLRKLRNDMMYDKMLDENDKPFSKEIKKDHVETINIALRDMARYIRIAAKDDEITEERMNEAYEKGVMDKENFNKAINMLGNFESYQKAKDKEARAEAARLKEERALQKQNNK